ncbi:FkbM family methyltransferase [Marimonas sp. MJW-29]|uniref:FkbM family methyltransferase n=1 Tax=Sulfitobacter sediminis TaxID=3234186 RepID=A0ABV3RPZ1_9RHOB
MMDHPHADPGMSAALRAAFRNSDKKMRQTLVPILPPEVVSFAGVRMYVDPRDNYTDRMIWRDGQPPEMQCLTALTEMVEGRNAFVLDIGANSGAYAVPLGVAAGAGSRVIAFEPAPAMIGRLGYNIRLNGLGEVVRIEGCALGAERGEAVLNYRSRNFGQASLMPIRPGVRDGGTLVPVRPLSDFIGEAEGHDISVLKIDVEGAEVAVLQPLLDAGGWLPDAMLVETDHADTWEVDLVARIKDLGFEITLEAEQNTLFVRKGGA